MAIALALVLSFVGTTGFLMADYAGQEAQYEEFEAASRAAVAALGTLLADDATDPAVAQRLVEVLEAMQPGYTAAAPTIQVGADDVISVTIAGTFTIENLGGGTEVVDVPATDIRVRYEHERYEIAMALDLTGSMELDIPSRSGGTRIVQKIDALKAATQVATDALDRAVSRPGTLLLSLVPFDTVVNVADTATAGGAGVNGATDAKRRYVRMLAGATDGGTPLSMDQILVAARTDAANGLGQWVDTFHRYGVGADLGPLRSRGLPADLLNDIDWDLRRTDVEIPVGEQFGHADAGDRMWSVDDEDFWNGCLMARWGAYWNANARPPGFRNNPVDPAYWPAVADVPGWSQAAPTLTDLPLHLSDAPPDRSNPHTLFTAYSWPDASITGPDAEARSVNHRMQVAMARLLDSGADGIATGGGGQLVDHQRAAYNDWTLPGGGGAAMCTRTPLTPLTEDVAAFRSSVAALSVQPPGLAPPGTQRGARGTYIVRGFVWALRSLSPLWQQVWDVQDTFGDARPGVPCWAGESVGCDPLLRKSIILVTDGAHIAGDVQLSGLTPAPDADDNPEWRGLISRDQDPVCSSRGASHLPHYHAAWATTTPQDFNQYFRAQGVALEPDDRFDSTVPAPLVDAFRWSSTNPGMAAALGDFTPWEVFRGPEPPFGRDRVAADALMDPGSGFALAGRPTGVTGYCTPAGVFGAYGGLEEHVLIGELDSAVLPPVSGVGPFLAPALSSAPPMTDAEQIRRRRDTYQAANSQLDDWLHEACRIAGERGVRVHAIYIGRARAVGAISGLERCVDASGGDPDADEVFVTPTARELRRAFKRIFAVRRNLRFVS